MQVLMPGNFAAWVNTMQQFLAFPVALTAGVEQIGLRPATGGTRTPIATDSLTGRKLGGADVTMRIILTLSALAAVHGLLRQPGGKLLIFQGWTYVGGRYSGFPCPLDVTP